MREYIERCKECFHFQVCANIMKNQLFIREKMLIEENPECEHFVPTADVVEVVRCRDCKFATELDKHCELSRAIYKHCSLLRGEPTDYVWHKYKRYYKNYSLVEADDYCSYGKRKDGDKE